MSMEKNVPEIRFEPFQDRWRALKIEDLILDEILLPPKDGNHGNIHPTSSDFVGNGIPFIMANNVKGGKIDVLFCSHIRKEQADTLQKGFSIKGDVLLTHKGTVGEVAIVPEVDSPYLMLTPQVTYYRVAKPKSLSNEFLAASFVTEKFQKKLKEEAGGGTRAYIGITKQRSLELNLPSQLSEQNQIGNFFQQLDGLITKHQQKHDKLKNIKKALIEKMFPQQDETQPAIRFKGFSGEWVGENLGRLAKITTGTSNREDSGLDGKYTFFDRSEDVRTSDIYLFDCEAVIVAGEGSDFLPKYFVGKFDLHQRTYAIMNFDSGDSRFLFYYVHLFRKHFLDLAVGSTVKSLRLPMFQSMYIKHPNLQEQRKVGALLQIADTLINQHQTQLTKLNNLKQSFLNKMFV